MKAKCLLSAMAFLVMVGAAHTQVTFTATGVATSSSSLGYRAGQAVTFSLTTTPSYQNNDSSLFDSSGNLWKEETVSDGPLWSAITGTSLSGSYVQPDESATSPASSLYVYRRTILLVADSDDVGGDIGLYVIPGQPITRFELDLHRFATLTFPESYLDPESYFSSRVGTYSGLTGRLAISTSSNTAYFDITDLTISVGQIPEPANLTVLAGALALSWCALRRSRRPVAAPEER